MLKLLKWLLQAGAVPVIIVLVWFFNIRPFSFLLTEIDAILAVDLAVKVAEKNIPITIYGAIDVAILTFLYNLCTIVISSIFRKPALVSVEISDRKSQQNFATLPFDEDNPGAQSPTYINLNGHIEIKNAKWIFDSFLKGVRVTVQWHPEWLSIEPQIDPSQLITINQKPGEIHFNFFDMLSESDWSTSIDGKLLVMANSNFKRNGTIGIKVEINSKYKLVRMCFNWILYILINTEVKPCKIELEKGS